MLDSIATVSLGGTLREKLEAISAAGFRAAEIFENDFVSSDLSAHDLRLLMDDLGLQNIAYQPFRDFEGLKGHARKRVFDRAERKFDLMQEMGTDLLLVCSSTMQDAEGDEGRIIDDFRELGERAASRGLRIGYEGLAWGRYINDHRDVAAIVSAVDLPSVGIILDSFHSLSRHIPISSIMDIDPAKIFLAQIADAPLMNMDILQWSRHFRCMPLQGGLPVTEWVAALIKIGYSGPLSLEIFNDRFRSGFSKTVAIDGKRSLVTVRDDAHYLVGEETHLPDRSDPAIKFIEFSVPPGKGEELGKILDMIGFEHIGNHKIRDVALWRAQDDVFIIINRESYSFSGSFSLIHGDALCAIGLYIKDRKAALERAHHLGMAVAENLSDSLSGRSINAIRSVGGSLVYFLDEDVYAELWEKEFEITQKIKPEIKGSITSFDHVASIVGYDEFLSWVLYWTSLFDLKVCQEVDLIDPGGVVQSQALESKNKNFRLTLNGSLGARTLASRFEKKFLGAGYQHIALGTDDIFAFSKRMRKTGLPILEINKNYYDEIQARFGLTDAFIIELSDGNILYDRDSDGGEFFQIFSRAIDRMFFFEIVQRVGEYKGYGAANTQVRLTAQRRAGEKQYSEHI